MALIYVDGELMELGASAYDAPAIGPGDQRYADEELHTDDYDWLLAANGESYPDDEQDKPLTAEEEDSLEEYEHRKRARLAEASEY
jgi:hypothetical protein